MGIISSSAISPSAISFSTLLMTTTPRLPELRYIAEIGLISFISFRNVLSESKIWDEDLANSLNMVIVPLLISFCAVIIYKITEIL